MSDAPAPKKVETAKSETAPASTPAADSAAKTTSSGGKSASQSSISHFSSVSTPQYRSGWEAIFGGGKKPEATGQDDANENELPGTLTLQDADISPELRVLLDEAFSLFAEKNGVDFHAMKAKSALKYSIECELSK